MKPILIINEDLVEQGFRTDIKSPIDELDCLVASRVSDQDSMLFVPELAYPPARMGRSCGRASLNLR